MKKNEYDEAVEKWREFHQKDEPKKEIDLPAKNFWPKRWSYAGLVSTCYYRSDKWEKDGKFNRYYHDHGKGIRCWHPYGLFQGGVRKSPLIPKFPHVLTVLGFSIGWDLNTPDGNELSYSPEKGEMLCCFPDGKVLVVVSEDGKLVALFEGHGLKIKDVGIVG